MATKKSSSKMPMKMGMHTPEMDKMHGSMGKMPAGMPPKKMPPKGMPMKSGKKK